MMEGSRGGVFKLELGWLCASFDTVKKGRKLISDGY